MCLEDSSGLFTAFRTLSCTHALPDIHLRQVVRKTGMLTSTATSQRFRPQLSVRNRTMTSAPADHDHNVFAGGGESRHSVVQTTVQLMAILGLHDRSHISRISTNVCLSSSCRSRDHRTFCSQSSKMSDRCTLQRSCLQNCRQTCLSLPLFPAHRGIPRFWDDAA